MKNNKTIVHLFVDGKVYPITATRLLAKMIENGDSRVEAGVNLTIYLIRLGKWKA